jgi:hypothetical protein
MTHMPRLNHAALLTGCAMLLAACATEAPKALPPTAMPALTVVVDCADCQVDPQVSTAIREAYDASAAQSGIRIDPARQATFTIKVYTQRGVGQRVVSILAGPLAFALKDEIKGVVSLDAQEEPLEYSYRIPFLGMGSVAKKVGEMSFDAVVRRSPQGQAMP